MQILFLFALKVISGTEWGNLLLWEGGLIKVEFCRTGHKPCHRGPISQLILDEGEVVTVGKDGFIQVSFSSALQLGVQIYGQQINVTHFNERFFMEAVLQCSF